MLVPLFDYLNSIDFTGAGMFQYVSFRSIMAFIFSLLIATFIGRKIILKLQRMQIGDVPRDLDVEGQLSKKGTPTMGGIIIFLSLIVPVLLFAKLDNIYIILMLISTVWLTLLGFADDYIKVFKKHREGLKGKFKIIGQVGIGLIVGLTLYLSPEVVIRENVQLNNGLPNEEVRFEEGEVKSTKTTIPFFKNNNLDYANLVCFMKEHKQAAGWVLFVLVTIFIVTAVSNGANLTDGLDGLTTGTSAIIGVGLGILAYVSSNMNFASYLNIMYIPGSEELVIYMSAFVGATVGFLWFNSFPAQVFMGDTGSLMLSGVNALFAIIIRKELMLLFFCGVFLLESLSVMMQVSYFKWTKKRYGVGKRIFKLAPLHNLFQKPGYAGIEALIQKPIKAIPESKIVVRFWIISLLLAALAIITLKIR